MPARRAVLLGLPPLLAELVRHVTTGRAGLSIIAEIADLETAAERMLDLAPDVVIIGPAATSRNLSAARVRSMLPRARVLALSADFTRLFGPGEDDVNEFTSENLVDSLRL
jgi:hypothetical protein